MEKKKEEGGEKEEEEEVEGGEQEESYGGRWRGRAFPRQSGDRKKNLVLLIAQSTV